MSSERHSIEEPDNRDAGGGSSEVFAELPEQRSERGGIAEMDETLKAGRDSLARRPKLDALRRDLADTSRRPIENSTSSQGSERASFEVRRIESNSRKPAGRLRRLAHLAMAVLGISGADKLQAADSNAQTKPDAIVAGVPVFKAPTQPSADTNVYNYQGETWQPKTEAEKEKMAKAKAALEAQKAAAKPDFSIKAAPAFGDTFSPNAEGPRRVERRPNTPRGGGQPLGYGGNPIRRNNFSQFGNQTGAAISLEAGIRTRPNYPDVIYHSTPAPTEPRELFGVKFDAATRNAALRGSRLGGPARGPAHHPKKPRPR